MVGRRLDPQYFAAPVSSGRQFGGSDWVDSRAIDVNGKQVMTIRAERVLGIGRKSKTLALT